jgi:DNA recombination-dependent growth factor C
MGLLNGTANFVEFKVGGGELPDVSDQFIEERVEAWGFKDIDDTYDEYAFGWVSVLDMFDSSFVQPVNNGDYVVMSMRVDERTVPGAVLKKAVAKEERRVMREKQAPRLSRGAKIDIKERVRVDLLRKVVPTPTVVEVCWEVSKGVIFFYSTNKKMQAIFEDLFKETFGLVVSQEVPYTVAEQFAAGGLDKVTECLFV